MSSVIHPTEFQIEDARIARAEDADMLRAIAAKLDPILGELDAAVRHAARHETAVAAGDAEALISLAADELRAGIAHLERLFDADLAGELVDAADAARAESRREGVA